MASLKDASKYLSLSDAIQTLKTELLKAEAIAKENEDALLILTECEIELSLEFNPTLDAGFNIGVFKIKAGAGATGGHKITVKFEANRSLEAFAGTPSRPKKLGPAKSTGVPPKLTPRRRLVR